MSEILTNRTVIIDGGLGTELVKLGHKCDSDPLWSARLLVTDANSIKKVHTSYLQAGADIIITASYQASVEGFTKHLGVTVEEALKLIKFSVQCAKEAVDEFCKTSFKEEERSKPLVAGSVGSYGAAQADGSEYDGNYVDHISMEQLMQWHRPRIQCLLEAGCDLLAMETIPAAKEGLALAKLLQEFTDAKAWLSFSCQSAHEIAHGDNVTKTFSECLAQAPQDRLVAIGFNCCPPQFVSTLLEDAAQTKTKIPLIVYPNSGQKWISGVGWSDANHCQPLRSYLETWNSLGAQFIGGCCKTSPDDTRDIFLWRQSKFGPKVMLETCG